MEGTDGDGKTQEELLAERERILAQLAEMGGSDSENDDNNEEARNSEEGGDPIEPEEPMEEPEELAEPVEPKTESPLNVSSVGDSEDVSKTRSDEDSENDDEENEIEEEEETATSPDDNRTPFAYQKWVPDHEDKIKRAGLPEGWSIVLHRSGMPLFYHKFTRVVTHSRPYQVTASAREHEIPLTAVPCLYRQAMDKYKQEKESAPETKEVAENPDETPEKPEASNQIAEDDHHPEKQILKPEEYREYCSKRFKFKEITVNRYKNPRDRHKLSQERRANGMLKKHGFDMDYDQLKSTNEAGEVLLASTSGGVLIDLTPLDKNRKSVSRKPYLMNPMGKTTVTVLNEFTQRMVKGQLSYHIEDTRNVSCPYKATAMMAMSHQQLADLEGQYKESLTVLHEISKLDDVASSSNADIRHFPIGRGIGANKKTARLAAAKDAISKLIPKLRVSEDFVCQGVLEEEHEKDFERESRNLFKQVPIDGKNVVQMCQRFGIPKPFALLKEAVARSLRWNGMVLETKKEMVGRGTMLSKVTLTLGDLVAEAEAIGAKQAQQYAAQLLFKAMHPEINNYGSFLELYARFDDKEKFDQARKHHEEVVRLPDTGNLLAPNHNVLTKLASEMKEVSMIYPPRSHLFGLANQSSVWRADVKSAQTQWSIEDIQPTRAVPPPPPPPPSANYFCPIAPAPPAVGPVIGGGMRQTAFMPMQQYRQQHFPHLQQPQYHQHPQNPPQQPPYSPHPRSSPPPKRSRFDDPTR